MTDKDGGPALEHPWMRDGGPAFPCTMPENCDSFKGMSLRCYIATAALQGLIACPGIESDGYTGMAEWAVEYADALIAELAKERT